MSYIIDGIFIGNKFDAFNPVFFKKNNIEAVLNTAFELPKTPFAKHYMKLSMSDSSDEKLLPNFVKAYSFLNEQRRKKRKILVHCSVGMSRSVSIVAAYLISKGMTYDTAMSLIKRNRPIANPNQGFQNQLIELEKHEW